jgi:hypothetical protein
MVMQIHTGEFEYIGTDGTVLHTAGSWAVGWTNSLLRVCVPLFVLISGFFLFPIGNERKFYKKRFTRVGIPFVVWCVIYALYYYAQGANSLRATSQHLPHPAQLRHRGGPSVVRLYADGDLPDCPCALAMDHLRKPEEHGTLPCAMGYDAFAPLHSPLCPTCARV